MKQFLSAVLVLGCCTWVAGCASLGTRGPAGRGPGPNVRVLIGVKSPPVAVEAKGGFQIESESGVSLMRSGNPATIEITRRGRSLQLRFEPEGSAAVAEGNVYITPYGGADLMFEGVPYAGRFYVQIQSGGALAVINVVPLETYLEGVLPHEIGDPGPDAFAALEAQAITARTYAMTRIEEQKDQPFDVHAGVRDQVYRGKARVSAPASSAVRETRGVVLAFDGELARTYYCATCGGHTSDIRRVWPQRAAAPYLLGHHDRVPQSRGSFCDWVHNFRWRYSFSGKEVGVMLRNTIPKELGVPSDRVGSIVDLKIGERSPSGRVQRLEIVTTKETFVVEGDRIRWVLMSDWRRDKILPSTMFDLQKRYLNRRVSFVSVVGGGNGHGVGMCQNGAIGMAKRGYTHRMILSHYYPGTKLIKRY